MSNLFYDFVREHSESSVHYLFQTNRGAIFSVFFNPAEFSDYLDELPYLSKIGCLFGFFPVDDSYPKETPSPLFVNTLYKIIEDYFNTYGTDKVLLFHCDNEDGKQKVRDRLFNQWFNKNPENYSLIKNGLQVEIERVDGTSITEYLGFIIYGNDTELLNKVNAEFISIAAMMITRKNQID